MSKKLNTNPQAKGIRAAKISPGDLLLHDPNAYVNLCLMFPHDARTIDEIPALTLPDGYMLALLETKDIVLISKTPPVIWLFDKKALTWTQA